MPTFLVYGPLNRSRVRRRPDVVPAPTSSSRCATRRRASPAATGSRFSTCSSAAKPAAWCCGCRSIGPDRRRRAEESVSVEDCANVSRDLSAILDVEDVVPTAYTLEVSSPGLDRPLRGADDYRRFAGRRAKLVMRERGGRAEVLQGPARRASTATTCSSTATMGGSIGCRWASITRANLEVEF